MREISLQNLAVKMGWGLMIPQQSQVMDPQEETRRRGREGEWAGRGVAAGWDLHNVFRHLLPAPRLGSMSESKG